MPFPMSAAGWKAALRGAAAVRGEDGTKVLVSPDNSSPSRRIQAVEAISVSRVNRGTEESWR
ncbi:hypothetical protein GCM10022221_71560 [Actinocorallia aurea]